MNIMRKMKLLVVALLLAPLAIFAQDGGSIDFTSAQSVITWLMPVITLGVTYLIKKILPFITGTVTLIAVPLVSSGIAYLGTIVDADTSFLVSFLVGLASVFLNQLYRSITQ